MGSLILSEATILTETVTHNFESAVLCIDRDFGKQVARQIS